MDLADDLVRYLDASVTPWHAVEESVRRLEEAGYQALDPSAPWRLEPGARVYVTRGGASLAAFEIGSAPLAEAGLRLVGAHTDSPNLRVKPHPFTESHGVQRLAVEPYGGVLLHTWLDRDLAIAGRVWCKTDSGLAPRLVDQRGPVARISSLAIHLNRKVNDNGLTLNKQKHMAPMLALTAHGSVTLGELLGIEDEIRGYDLCLYDAVAPCRGGARGELVFSGRLDNLASCHAGLAALLGAGPVGRATRGVVLYDHEEVGSSTSRGADSPFLSEAIERIVGEAHPEARARALGASLMISADMAHAVHPNYPDVHEPAHMPALGAGPVVKTNSNQRYATDGEMIARFSEWCETADVTPQHFVTRSDLACGSTIGPISASRLGLRTIDVGNPMLSMHSCRELCAAGDVAPMVAVMRAFFEDDR